MALSVSEILRIICGPNRPYWTPQQEKDNRSAQDKAKRNIWLYGHSLGTYRCPDIKTRQYHEDQIQRYERELTRLELAQASNAQQFDQFWHNARL